MAGSKESARKARDTLLRKDPNHYKKMGAKGGKVSKGGGFVSVPGLAQSAGTKGGRASAAAKRDK